MVSSSLLDQQYVPLKSYDSLLLIRGLCLVIDGFPTLGIGAIVVGPLTRRSGGERGALQRHPLLFK